MHVAGTRRQIHHEIVQLAPVHAEQALLERLVRHRAAPDQRLISGAHVAHRHELHAVGQAGIDPLVLARLGRLARAHQNGNAGAVDVGVEESHPRPALRERDGEIGRDGRLADAALSASDGDDVPDALEDARVRRRGPAHLGGHVDPHFRDTGDSCQNRLLGLLPEAVLDGAGGGGQVDVKGDGRTFDLQVSHEVEAHDIPVQVGIHDGAEGI